MYFYTQTIQKYHNIWILTARQCLRQKNFITEAIDVSLQEIDSLLLPTFFDGQIYMQMKHNLL